LYVTEEASQDENFKGKLTPLAGNMPSEIGLLTSLERLVIVGMKVSGPILEYINGTEKLTILDVHNNNFNGFISESFSKEHPALSYLDLERNSFSGKIPNSIGNFSSLVTFNVQENQINGSIPSEIGAVSTLSTYYTKWLNTFVVMDH
jgi:Leucine-rich repeat (LRR) protein